MIPGDGAHIDETVSPEAAERVDAGVDALLAGRPPAVAPYAAEEVDALRGAALLAGSRQDVSDPDLSFVAGLAGRLRSVMEPQDAAAPAPAAASAPAPAAAEPLPPRRPGRRAFLIGAGAAAAAAAAGVLGEKVVDNLRDSSTPQYGGSDEAALVPDGAAWRDVAALAAVRTAGPVRFRAGAIEGVLVAVAGGGVAAFSAVCTHQGCVLDVAAARDRLVCPCHQASFGLDGTPDTANYIPLPNLPALRSRVAGDRVEVLA